MVIPVVVAYYAGAGAVAMGGAAAAKLLHSKAQHLAALEYARQDVDARTQYIKTRISLEEMRRKAAEVGLDPDLIDEGYKALQAKKVTPDEVREFLESSAQPPD